MKKSHFFKTIVALVLFLNGAVSFSWNNQEGKIAIVAHRGYWKCEESAYSQNSMASLVQAQNIKVWGIECDIHLTSDGKIIVNHDEKIDGLVINKCSYEQLSGHLLPNGECRPEFGQFLKQVRKGVKHTKLVVEFKYQSTAAIEDTLIMKTVEELKKYHLFDPAKVMFITFSPHSCKKAAELAPGFTVQYLSGNMSPKEAAEKLGASGIDYEYNCFVKHPEWVVQAHELGMSVNVWTVDSPEKMRRAIEWGVDAITTNQPLVLREILGLTEHQR